MKCRLIIKSEGDGWTDSLDCTGEMTVDGESAEIIYAIGGDACRLTVTPSIVKQVRKGQTEIEISFRENIVTDCKIGGEGLNGGFPVFTKYLSCRIEKYSCGVRLCYLSGGEEEVKMRINAVYTARNQL